MVKTRETRKPYQTSIAMFPREWDILRAWTAQRGITGAELIASILTEWVRFNPAPEVVHGEPDELPQDGNDPT